MPPIVAIDLMQKTLLLTVIFPIRDKPILSNPAIFIISAVFSKGFICRCSTIRLVKSSVISSDNHINIGLGAVFILINPLP